MIEYNVLLFTVELHNFQNILQTKPPVQVFSQ